jgi:hypothetical protein
MKIITITLLTLCAAQCGCGTAKVSGRHEIGAAPTGKPTMVYVSDFDLDAANIKSERGMLPTPPKLPGLGPTIVLGPAGVAARFIIASQDLDRNIKQTASKIAGEVVQRTKRTIELQQTSL